MKNKISVSYSIDSQLVQADYIYKTLRSEITNYMMDNALVPKPSWRYYYGGESDLDTKITHFEVSYEPDQEEEWIIKRAYSG